MINKNTSKMHHYFNDSSVSNQKNCHIETKILQPKVNVFHAHRNSNKIRKKNRSYIYQQNCLN